jgi:hypothetical protein
VKEVYTPVHFIYSPVKKIYAPRLQPYPDQQNKYRILSSWRWHPLCSGDAPEGCALRVSPYHRQNMNSAVRAVRKYLNPSPRKHEAAALELAINWQKRQDP